MKVVCTKVPPSPAGKAMETSLWVTVGSEYHVVSVLAEPDRRLLLQIVTDDGHSLGLFGSENFVTVDETLSERWISRIGAGGVLELGPAAFLAPGFWEAYYDGDASAEAVVEEELQALR